MQRIESVDNLFHNGNPATNTKGTEVSDSWLNSIQEEIAGVVEGAGLALDDQDDGQLLEAISSLISDNVMPIGSELGWPTSTLPAGFVERDGSELSMTTYEPLYDVLGSRYGLDTGVVCTFINGTDLVNKVGHGLADDNIIELSNSGGGLPPELAAATKYFVVNALADTFQVSLAKGGDPIDFTTDGTGTNYFHVKFKLADDRGLFDRYWNHGAGVDPDAASRTDRGDGTTGDNVGTYQDDEFKSHTHTGVVSDFGTSGAGLSAASAAAPRYNLLSSAGGNETRGKNRYKMAIIKAYIA